MSRYATHDGMNQTAAAVSMLTSITAKEDQYKQNILKNHAITKSIAQRLMKEAPGGFEDVLLKSNIGESTTTQGSSTSNSTIYDNDKIQSFLQEQRDRIKNIARTNVENERETKIFCSAIKILKGQMETNTLNPNIRDEDQENIIPDFQEMIENLMDSERSNAKSTQISVEQEPMYREMCEALGQPVIVASTASNKKKKGNRRTSDDDTIMVMSGTGPNANSTSSLKCPISGTFMEDPVKNKVCHHVYSRMGIESHIRNGARSGNVSCPVPGCQNRNVQLDHLEQDVETAILIRQERRRQDRQQEIQASQATEVDDEDDDENEY